MPDQQLKPGDDSAAEGTDAAFPDDTEQELSMDHAAFLEALDRIHGRKPIDYGENPTDPAYRAAVEKHIGAIMYDNWMKQMAPQVQAGTIYNNSVTPSASSLK